MCTNATQPGFKPDSTWRFLRYNSISRQVSVLFSGLSGVDVTCVLVPELSGKRISKYWLAGPKANTAETFLNFVGNPNKIKRAERYGEFFDGGFGWIYTTNTSD